MRAWWDNLAAREQRLVAAVALVLLLALVFLFVIEPGLEQRKALTRQLQDMVNEQAWMEAQAPAVRARAQAAPAGSQAASTGGSALGVVDVSARAAGLGSALRRVRPQESAVEAELEGAPYADLVRWLATLESRHGLRIVTLSIDRGAEPGRVNAQLRIEPASGRS
jgi:general secretion pathway protein M